jgi:hypothetical protein
MKTRIVLAILLTFCAAAALQNPAKKGPDIQILDVKGQRDGDRAVFDGRIRIGGERPILEVFLVFDFLADRNSVIASKEVRLDEERLEPGDETAFHLETLCPGKAAAFRIRAQRAGNSGLSISGGGPYPLVD